MDLKVGDIVRIRKDSEYYGDDPYSSPADEEGTIIFIAETDGWGGTHHFRVQWSNSGETNCYRESDLYLVSRVKPKIKGICNFLRDMESKYA